MERIAGRRRGAMTAGVLALGLVIGAGVSAPVSAAPRVPAADLLCGEGGSCKVGDTGPGGGIVVYDAGSVQNWGRYLEVAPNGWSGSINDPASPWCNESKLMPAALGKGIGDGVLNTAAMLQTCTSGAANLADAYVSPVFDAALKVPSAPRSVRAVMSRGAATISWKPPATDGGSAIIEYVVTTMPPWYSLATCTTTKLTCRLTGLDVGKRYQFVVQARNARGMSAEATVPRTRVPRSLAIQQATAAVPAAARQVMVGGKSDWFLPSLSELSLIQGAGCICLGGLGGTGEQTGFGYYWSSTQADAAVAWSRDIRHSNTNLMATDASLLVRPMRAF